MADDKQPKTEQSGGNDKAPHKVDEAVQEDAAKERAKNEGYD